MKRYRQFEPILISDFEVSKWQHPVHQHNHYEMIYIKKGSGIHVINQISIPYQAGDVFLLGPEEAHYFEIDKPSRFIYLKFTDLYLNKEENNTYEYIQNLEYLIKSRETHLSGFKLRADDRLTVELIFDLILSLKNNMLWNRELIWMQILTLSHILKRNMPELLHLETRSRDMQAIFCYIHKNIYLPDELRVNVMAKYFNITTDYMGPYFKRNAGTTLRAYIQHYRSALLKQRIASGKYSLKQIAAEFGLTDESHVSKIIQKANSDMSSN
ncbi:AraC family transcriptional regulator [Pedobacter punctiformis]|uniref:AraC family transcriptional regulator n=1 Tax=Pedobacter punctiformis TaxID=3004097 RepID=A0ABT4L849_9SPHI|nr:AraC family transcriptional regulator [Pedobacter sp. HCMS5-2]MCZ4244111.1 AraC family transcriptional regulator [Pedobacter sp. HCMS5-2]